MFSFPHRFLADADIKVLLVDTTTEAETLKTLTTHYTLTGAGGDAGGNVTFLSAPSSTQKVVIYLDVAKTQPVELEDLSALPLETLEEQGFDRIVLMVQRLASLATRSVRLREGYTGSFDGRMPTGLGADGANKVLALAADGLSFVLGPTVDTIAAAITAAAAAAASAATAATQAANAATSAAAALVSQAAAAASAAAAAAYATAVSNCIPNIVGSPGSPISIVAGTGIPFAGSKWFNTWYVQGSGGVACDISADPQIAVPTAIGQRLRIVGCSDVATVKLEHGTGLSQNGVRTLGADESIDYEAISTTSAPYWRETTWSGR